MTTEEFHQDPTRRSKLTTLLEDHILASAFAIALEQMEPAAREIEGNPVLASSRANQRAGAREFLKLVRKLTTAPKDLKKTVGRTLAKTDEDIPTNFKP